MLGKAKVELRKKRPWLLRMFFGDEILPSNLGIILKNIIVRIPIQQAVFMESKGRFFRGSIGVLFSIPQGLLFLRSYGGWHC